MQQKKSTIASIDWVTILIYLALLAFGWISICGACYEYGQPQDFLSLASLGTRTGMQLVWIGSSMVLAAILLLLDDRIYDTFSYIIYAAILLLLLATPFMAHNIRGSLSWISFGRFSIQPAEFAKCATSLALAKFMSSYEFRLQGSWRNLFLCIALLLMPMVLIIMQKETGSALIYLSLFLMLYREGMPGSILFTGIAVVAYVVVGLRFSEVPLIGQWFSLGDALVLAMIAVFVAGLLLVYCSPSALLEDSGIMHQANIRSLRLKRYFYIALFALASLVVHFSANIVVDHMPQHQQKRIQVLLGLREDPNGVGYNQIQARIAIGSGGLAGKGFLNGTQTKLKYVPEQETDFIFCTVGEEQGFIGSAVVLVLFLILLWRLIYLAERQPTVFGRVYGYCVFSIFTFHVVINVGMVLGLMPVIGIPLPFFSYGGSSLWGFTLLLFIFLRTDAGRTRLQR